MNPVCIIYLIYIYNYIVICFICMSFELKLLRYILKLDLPTIRTGSMDESVMEQAKNLTLLGFELRTLA